MGFLDFRTFGLSDFWTLGQKESLTHFFQPFVSFFWYQRRAQFLLQNSHSPLSLIPLKQGGMLGELR